MKTRWIYFVVPSIFLFILAISYQLDRTPSCVDIPPQRIAHAGGGYQDRTYTNSLEALNDNYQRGYRFFELDFNWTSDNQIVLIHDWDFFAEKLLGKPGAISLDEFNAQKGTSEVTLLTLRDAVDWLKQHPDAYIITDIKEDNVKGLTVISQQFPKLRQRIIPQIYATSEYEDVSSLGFCSIIFTLYETSIGNQGVVDFASQHKLHAVTMPIKRAQGQLPSLLQDRNVTTYAHTINDDELRKSLQNNGISEVYTDFLPLASE